MIESAVVEKKVDTLSPPDAEDWKERYPHLPFFPECNAAQVIVDALHPAAPHIFSRSLKPGTPSLQSEVTRAFSAVGYGLNGVEVFSVSGANTSISRFRRGFQNGEPGMPMEMAENMAGSLQEKTVSYLYERFGASNRDVFAALQDSGEQYLEGVIKLLSWRDRRGEIDEAWDIIKKRYEPSLRESLDLAYSLPDNGWQSWVNLPLRDKFSATMLSNITTPLFYRTAFLLAGEEELSARFAPFLEIPSRGHHIVGLSSERTALVIVR